MEMESASNHYNRIIPFLLLVLRPLLFTVFQIGVALAISINGYANS